MSNFANCKTCEYKYMERLLRHNNGGKAYVLRVEAVAELTPSDPVWIKQ